MRSGYIGIFVVLALSSVSTTGLACGGSSGAGATGAAGEAASEPPPLARETGLTEQQSSKSHADTVAAAQRAIENRGLRLFAKIDHAANAQGAGRALAPSTVLIFGAPKVGSKLMNAAPTFAIDLPMKMLVIERGGEVFVIYNDPAYLAFRHGMSPNGPVIARVTDVLAAIASEAVAAPGTAVDVPEELPGCDPVNPCPGVAEEGMGCGERDAGCGARVFCGCVKGLTCRDGVCRK